MASYVSLDNLTYYDGKIKTYIGAKDAEVLARAGVTIEEAASATSGSATTYVVYQNYSETGNPDTKTKIEIGKIEIPLDQVIESGSVKKTPADETNPAKAELIFVLANTTDATTTSGKKEISVDITSVASDSDLTSRVENLETQVGKDKTINAYQTKEDLVDIVNVLTADSTTTGSIDYEIYNSAVNAKYGTKTVEGVTSDVTIKDFIDGIKDEAVSASVVTVDANATVETGYLKTYAIYQGEKKEENLISKINIPKDFLVKSGEIVNFSASDTLPAGVSEVGKYLKLVINVADDSATSSAVYIKVSELVDAYTVQDSAAEIQLAISDSNEISATIVDASISRDKIDSDFEDDLSAIETTVGSGYKIAEVDATIKEYIDSRIFVGDQDAYDAAILAKTIDSTTFAVITDENAEGFTPITESNIDDLFA